MSKVLDSRDAEKFENVGWHHRGADSILVELTTARGGLSQNEAAARLDLYGFNRLPAPPKHNIWLRFFRHFNNMLMYILLATA